MTDIRLITCVGVEHDLALLPHFLAYYLGLGIPAKNIHAVLQAPEDNTPEMEEAVTLLRENGIEPQEIWIAPYTSKSMWAKRREIQKSVADPHDWVISADVDEFHEFPTDLKTFFAYCDKKQRNCVQGIFIDRLAPEGKLTPIRQDTSIWEQYPVQADVMCTIRQHEDGNWPTGTVNIMASKGNILPALGGHSALAGETPVKYLCGVNLGKLPGIGKPHVRFATPLRVHHFKWTDRLLSSLKKRLSTPGVSERGKIYGEALLSHIDEKEKIQLDKMPLRSIRRAEQLPWKHQLKLFSLRVIAIRSSNKFKRITNNKT